MQIYIVILILAAAIAYAAWTIARAIRQKDPCCGCEMFRLYGEEVCETCPYADDFAFIADLGLKENLSPTRANGLVSMMETIRKTAEGYE